MRIDNNQDDQIDAPRFEDLRLINTHGTEAKPKPRSWSGPAVLIGHSVATVDFTFAAVVLALYASVVLSVGNPIHGQLFSSSVHGGGHDLPVGIHVVRDGLLALTTNETLAVILATLVLGRTMLLTSWRLPLSRPVAVEPR